MSTDHNTLRTEPLQTGKRSGVRCITIQVKCISFIEGGHPSDYWRSETCNPVDTSSQIKSDSVLYDLLSRYITTW